MGQWHGVEPTTFFLRNFKVEFWPYLINYYGIVYLNSAQKTSDFLLGHDRTGSNFSVESRMESNTCLFFRFFYIVLCNCEKLSYYCSRSMILCLALCTMVESGSKILNRNFTIYCIQNRFLNFYRYPL